MVVTLHIAGIFVQESFPKILHIGHLFVPEGQDHILGGQIVSYFAHFATSFLLGILYINIFRITGRDWATTKGLIFGATNWILIFGISGKLLHLPMQSSIPVAFIMIIGHLIFGLATSWSIFWLSERFRL